MKAKEAAKVIVKLLGATTITIAAGVGTIKLIDHAADDYTESYVNYTPVAMTYHVDRNLYDIPDGDTSFKSFMDFRCITNTDSAQYELQQSCYTDEDGMRRYNTDYVIAMGSYYTSKIGSRYRIQLDGGRVFYATVGDFKADEHTDAMNQYTASGNGSKNIVEFIVDTDALPDLTKEMGDISYNGFNGNVTSIERIDD